MGQVNRISKTGLDLVKGYEGLRRRSDPLPGGGWIVGYGHTRSAREGVEVTEREAEYLLRYDLQDFEEFVSHSVHAPLNQNEFDALVSFAWNVGKDSFGKSDVLNYVNAGEMLAAAESFSAWRKARIGGRLIVVDALVRRRSAEKNLFLSHPSGPPSAPSLIVKPELDVAASVLALSDGALSIEAKMNAPDAMKLTSNFADIAANDQVMSVRTAPVADVEDAVIATELVEDEVAEDVVVEETVAEEVAADEAVAEETAVVDDIPVNEALLDDAEETDDEDEAASTASVWDAVDAEIDADIENGVEEADLDIDEDEAETALAVEESDSEDDVEGADSDDGDQLSRAMAAASLAAFGEAAATQTQVLEAKTDVDVAEAEPLVGEVFETETEELVVEVVEVELSDVTEAEEPVADVFAEAAEAASESAISIDVDEAAVEENVWSEVPTDAPEGVQAVVSKPLTYGDPVFASDDYLAEHPHLAPEDVLPMSGHRKKESSFIGLLPFGLLAIIGLVMMTLGLMDFGRLVQSETPIDENQLYAGPFLTLIGGFGLVFGVYFLIRKLLTKDN